jgi:hypothetical protein
VAQRATDGDRDRAGVLCLAVLDVVDAAKPSVALTTRMSPGIPPGKRLGGHLRWKRAAGADRGGQ